MKKIIAVLLALLMLSACAAAANTTAVQTITAQQAHDLVHSGDPFILLDVRTAAEHYARRIAGAVNIPYDELAQRASTELPQLDMRVLIYCQSGRRSAIAAQTLATLDYTQVYDFGGINDWPFGTVSGEEITPPPSSASNNALTWVIVAVVALLVATVVIFRWIWVK